MDTRTEISDDAQNLLKGIDIDLDDENSNEHTILPITLQTMNANQLTFEDKWRELFR